MNRRRFLLALLGAAPAPITAPAVVYGGRVSRATVMARAHDWLRRGVRYSQHNGRARWDVNRGRRYRPDCSGFVCMAWAVDSRDPRYGRALTTWELPRVATRIGWAALQPGDILLRTRRRHHVRLFESWADPHHATATVIESSGKAGGMRRHVVTVSRAARFYRPYRYRRIV